MRKITNINKGWLFTKSETTVPSSLPENWEALDLPHTWNGVDGQDGGNDYYRGKCFYCKEIGSAQLTSECCFLEFDAVNSTAEVFWNGKSLGTHHGGYSRFRFRIPKEDIKEVNLLCVTADNTPCETEYPQTADFTFYGGIYRDVKLICVDSSHFDLEYYGTPGIMVTPVVNDDNSATINVKAFVTNPENTSVEYGILDGESLVCRTTSDGTTAEATLKIENVHRWNGRKDPFLYTMVATLIKDGNVVDRISTRFGCRSFKFDAEKGFILNGKEYALRGVSRHQDNPNKGNALSYEDHKRDIELIYEVGANTIRLAHYQHSQDFYDLCDEYGFVLWAEIPYISRHMPEARDNTISQMTELVTQNYNHPSIVTWGLSNEITITGSNPDLLENHKILNDLCHKLDETRPTTLAAVTMCSIDDPVVHISDILSYNHYFGWYGGTTDMNGKWFDDFHKKYPDRVIGLSEYGCEALNWHTSEPSQGDYTEEYQSYYHEELIKQIAVRPYLWATHVWNMFDFAADARAEGGENGMNHKGLVTFDRQYKKDSFYAYKAWLSDEKVLHICSKRYVKRTEEVTKVTVYSNCPEVELFANGVSVAKQTKGDFPFFYFEVKNQGETLIEAKADGLTDTATIIKVDTPCEEYVMQEENQVINWFEITTPAGYYSINDSVGDIMASFKGKIALFRFLMMLKNTLSKGSKSGKPEVMGFSFKSINLSMIKSMYGMVKGFTIKRAFMMLGGDKFTKEQILGVNTMLNKIKKKK